MSFNYTQSDLQSGMNRGVQGKQDMLADPQETMNEAVREVLSEIRIRSTRRRQPLVPNLLNAESEYVAPSDLEGNMLIDVPQNAKRSDGEFTLVPTEQFARSSRAGDIAVSDYNGIRSILINSAVSDNSIVIDAMSSDSWQAFGVAENVESTTNDFIKGNSSIEYDLSSSSGTTAGIYNDVISSVDLTDYIEQSASIFTYARVTSETNLTNFKLRIGSSASAYYEFTVTTRNDGSVITSGWNLLRFDLSSPTTTGSPDVTALTYVALYMTKTTGKVSEDGYMFNYLVARKGKYADVEYYSKFGWQSSAGAYKENSTITTDILVANTDEYDLFVKKARCIAADECDLPEGQQTRLIKKYLDAVANYILKNPSEDKTIISSYYDYDNEQLLPREQRTTPWTNGPAWDGSHWD